MSCKRVCILHHVGDMGGGSKSLLDLSDMLKAKYKIIVCIPIEAISLKMMLMNIGVEVKEIKTPFPSWHRYSGGTPILSRGTIKSLRNLLTRDVFCKEVEECKPDAIIFNSVVTIVTAPGFNKNILKICIIRETLLVGLSTKYFRFLLEKYFIAVGFLAKAERDKIGLQKAMSFVIPDCVPIDNIINYDRELAKHNFGIDTNVYVVLFMGGSARIKGGEVVLKAINRLGVDYRLLLAGQVDENELSIKAILSHWFSPWYLLHIMKFRTEFFKAKKNGLVIETGYLQDISLVMSATDIVVFPSVFVHQPRPCIEAGYYGKAVILSDFYETKEYFIDGINAITFKPRSWYDLSRKIEYAKNNRRIIQLLEENNKKMSNKYHNYESTQLLLFEVLKNILG